MGMVLTRFFVIAVLIPFFGFSCVSKSKFSELENKNQTLSQDLNKTQASLSASESKIIELETLINQLEQRLGEASTDQESMRASVLQMKKALQEATERKREAEKRIQEYRDLVQRFRQLTNSGELSVKIVDGRMVVVLPSDVLFSSGSAKLSEAGQKTLVKVTGLLASIPDKKYQIEGHTDNVPIKTSRYSSNWDLAADRAINVVQLMIDNGMDEYRLSAASFSAIRPVESNGSAKGRKANRRIEIVIVPDLSTLPGYEELQKYSDS